VTAFEKQHELMAPFEAFGFRRLTWKTDLDEAVLAKPLAYSAEDYASTSPLEFNIRFGPPHIKVDGSPIFIIPIQTPSTAQDDIAITMWSPISLGHRSIDRFKRSNYQ
jgi:hypothetical protein